MTKEQREEMLDELKDLRMMLDDCVLRVESGQELDEMQEAFLRSINVVE